METSKPIVKEVARTQFVCPYCSTEYDSEESAKCCIQNHDGVEEMKRQFNKFHWYRLRSKYATSQYRWILAGWCRKALRDNWDDNSCKCVELWFYDVLGSEQMYNVAPYTGDWNIEECVSMIEGWKQYGLYPSNPKEHIKDTYLDSKDWGMIKQAQKLVNKDIDYKVCEMTLGELKKTVYELFTGTLSESTFHFCHPNGIGKFSEFDVRKVLKEQVLHVRDNRN